MSTADELDGVSIEPIDSDALERDAAIAAHLFEAPKEGEQRVTPLELFFDLVFVFAITQTTGYVSAAPSWTRLLDALAILAVLWFAWTGYAWLGNTANSDEGLVRVILFAAMAAMLIASLAVPRAFGGDGLIFGVAYFAVRVLHIACYAAVARARNDATLATVVWRLGSTIIPAAALVVVAGALSGTARAACWCAALLLDYGGVVVRGVEGWRIEPGHFAERHSAVIIIALGESIVSLGVGAGAVPLDAGVIAGALLGFATAAALWWAYFDVVSIVAERRLRSATPHDQVLIARDSYSYLHLPMVAGIVLFAIGVKRTLEHVGGHLPVVVAVALCGRLALYLLALSAFKRRNVGSFNRPRLVVAALLVCLIPAAAALPALQALGIVSLVTCGLIAFEVRHYAQARDRIRHGG
ncbi:MAG TPA: low temperature requirement protein A [Solirubrobacteraceae bacterium]